MTVIIAFDIGRTLPNMDLSQDFMELVVLDGWVDRHHKEKEPGIEIGLGLFDPFDPLDFCIVLPSFILCARGKTFFRFENMQLRTIAVDIYRCLREVCMTAGE